MTLSISAIVQLVASLAPTVKNLIDIAESDTGLIAEVTALSSPLASLLEGIGAELFPSAAPAIQAVGGIIASFDPNTTKWLQGSLNSLLGTALNPPLVVDGIYGAKTAAAVQQAQTKYGLVVDGVAGQITQAAIQAALANLPNLKPAA